MIQYLVNAIVQVVIFSVIPFVWWLISTKGNINFLKWIGLRRPIIRCSIRKLLLIIVTVSVTYILLMIIVMTQLLGDIDTATTQFDRQGWNALLYILIYAIIQTSLSEEILFRGFIGKRLIKRLGFTAGNTVQAILFGLLHGLPFGLVSGNILVTVILTLIPGAIGWIEGWINEKYATGSIIPSWIMHATMNLISALSSAF